MSFLSKVRTFAVGTANNLVDKVIDMNSPTMVRQYVRDLEDALGKLQSEAVGQAGQVRTLQRESDDLTSKIEIAKTAITKILAGSDPNKQGIAHDKAGTTALMIKQQADMAAQLAKQKETSASIDKAGAQLQSKHDQMVIRVRELENLDRDSKGKEQAARAMQSAGKILGNTPSIDNIEDKMRRRNDVAEEGFQRAMGTMAVPEDPEMASAADDLLAQLQPKETVNA